MTQKSRPLVSVLMTAFNREMYIAEAIESVLASTYKEFELIIVDDCSSDNTLRIAKFYEELDERISVYVNEKNLGDYPNRNKAASFANGVWMMYVDSDDLIKPDGIFKCVNAMEAIRNASFGIHYIRKQELASFFLDGETAIATHLYKEPFLSVGPGGTIIKKSVFDKVGGYPEKYGPSNDMYFNLKIISEYGVVFLPFDFFVYRLHDGQEKNNKFVYLYYNYCYLRDALNELNLGLTKNELVYFQKKNNRRFVINLYQYYRTEQNLKLIIKAWKIARFSWLKFFTGIFHFSKKQDLSNKSIFDSTAL